MHPFRPKKKRGRVAIEMTRYFKQDFRRVGHAIRAVRYAEQIEREEGGNFVVILCAAYLHGIGIKEAERKHDSTATKYQEEEGAPIARKILNRLGAKEELIDEVCDIVGHHHQPKEKDTVHYKSLYDAALITNLEEKREALNAGFPGKFHPIINGCGSFTFSLTIGVLLGSN